MAQTYDSLGKFIHKTDPEPNRQKTSSQVLSAPSVDSRLPERRAVTDLTYKRIREIRRDATIRLARAAVVAPMIHTPWQYKELKGAPSDALAMVEGCLKPIRDWFIQNAVLGALDFGWQPFEIIYKYDEGYMKVVDLKQLLQDFTTILVYEDTGGFAGLVNEPYALGMYTKHAIIAEKYAANFILEYEGTNWYGSGVYESLDSVHDDYDDVSAAANRYDKKVSGATWCIYYPVGTTPYNGETLDNYEIARRLLNRCESSGSLAIPDEVQEWLDDSIEKDLKGKWRVELIYAQGAQSSNFIDRQKYLDALKMRAFGLPERAILEGTHGTKAEADTHSNVALATIDTKHRLICQQVNYHIIRKLMRLNYGKGYDNHIYIEPAPVVDSKFATIKRVYELILQNQNLVEWEAQSIDMEQLRAELDIPSQPAQKLDLPAYERANQQPAAGAV